MRTVNKVIILGNLGRDAETTVTSGGVAVTKFSVATERRWKDKATNEWKAETDWINCVGWRKEGVAEYLKKGTTVYCEGRLSTSSYEDRDGKKVYRTEVVVEEIILAGGKSGENRARLHQEEEESRW